MQKTQAGLQLGPEECMAYLSTGDFSLSGSVQEFHNLQTVWILEHIPSSIVTQLPLAAPVLKYEGSLEDYLTLSPNLT